MNRLDCYIRFRYYLDTLIDLCSGRYFGGLIKTRFAHLGAHDTDSSGYVVLEHLFRHYPVRASDVLVDVGCGCGRVIHWWLRRGYRNRIVGIELDGEIAARTRRTFKHHRNVEIIHANVLDTIPEEGTLFYLYNPFDGEVTAGFSRQLKQLCASPDRVRIYYVNCQFLDVFTRDPFWTVRSNFDPGRGVAARPVAPLDMGLDYPAAVITMASAEGRQTATP